MSIKPLYFLCALWVLYKPIIETQLDLRTKGDIKEVFKIGDCILEPE
jgi:hypothetical protein